MDRARVVGKRVWRIRRLNFGQHLVINLTVKWRKQVFNYLNVPREAFISKGHTNTYTYKEKVCACVCVCVCVCVREREKERLSKNAKLGQPTYFFLV